MKDSSRISTKPVAHLPRDNPSSPKIYYTYFFSLEPKEFHDIKRPLSRMSKSLVNAENTVKNTCIGQMANACHDTASGLIIAGIMQNGY
jgi:hypothetical protein